MTRDNIALYNALASRDPRFDGVFFVGVTSTGVYCRPVCPSRTPKPQNCRFFTSAEAAERASFRPCLRCRPELAPGNAPVDDAHRIATLVAQRIEEGMLDDGARLDKVAERFGWSARQIRRLVHNELGVSPMELVLTRRLLLAKQLLTDTALPMTNVAYASGFSSVRRFNDAFSKRYRMPPTRLRRAAAGRAVRSDGAESARDAAFTLQLAYRPPFDWNGLIEFLAGRAIRGVEWVRDDVYHRTVQLGVHTGWVRVRHAPGRHALLVDITHTLMPALPALLGRLRHLFDLSARPDMIRERLGPDARLGRLITRNPGLRVPGAFDGFEMAVRAVLGQQITVKAASTSAGRFAAAFGDAIATPPAELTRLAPGAERIAGARVEDVAALGIIRTRARSIIRLAEEVASGRLRLEAGTAADETMARLMALPGIGAWTAQYIAMRALRWPDAFPREDIVLRKRLGGVTASRAEAMSQAWRPWRSYATMHLWHWTVPDVR
jgi:AraC family transcriptional regulator of adaptative response / DNA-3-methyladenine glycosylase II